MSGSRLGIRFARRWAVAGIACGSLTVPGIGCHSPLPLFEPTPGPSTPSAPRSAPLYPGLPANPVQLGVRRDSAQVVPVRAAEAVHVSVGNQVQVAGGIEPPNNDSVPTRRPTPSALPAVAGSDEMIDLEVALRLAGVDNPTINLAREQVQEAIAGQLAARSLLLPSINIGGNYHLHNGNLQSSSGLIRNVNDEQSLYLGLGARALAAETVAYPGVRLFAHLGDAVYEPLAARQRVAARRSDALAVQNDILLRVSTAYLALVGAEARLEVLRKAEVDLTEIVRVTREFALKGQGRQADADRTVAHAELLHQELHRAEEVVGVASAQLCQLLNLDPGTRLHTPGGAIPPLRLIPEDAELEPLVRDAVRTRPELLARSAEILEAQVRARQERVRPFVPLVSVGFSGGWFGGGSNQVNPQFGPIKGRTDFDAFAVWNIQNLGFGNRAQVRRADATVGQAVAAYDLTLNQIRREVGEAQADARAAARQIELSKTALATAEEGLKLEADRIRQGQGRPIEALDSFQQLTDAWQEFVRAVIAFDIAQFRLFVALGSNPLAIGSPPPVK